VAIERAEAGDTPSAMLLDDYARIFGLSVRGLLRGDAEDGSAALLFRSMVSAGSALDDVIEVKLHRLLGEFLQCVSAVAELRAMLGDRSDSSMSAWPSPEPLPHTRDRRETIGLRPPWFADLVLSALSRDLIDEVEARRLMGLRLDETMAGRPAIRPRWRDAMDVAVDYVQRHLQGVYAAEQPSERLDGGFDVEVHRVLADGNQHLGVLHLTSSLKVREPVSWIRAAG